MDPGTLIRDARRRAGLTQRLLARRAGTSHSTLAAYESGTKVPALATLLRLVEAAGFQLTLDLVPAQPFEDRRRRGEELIDVLELAELFPTQHSDTLDYPPVREQTA